MENKIGNFQAISLILIVMMNKILLNIPKEIIKQTHTGAIFNVLYITILAILISVVICKLFKRFPENDIIDISYFIGKKPLQIIIGLGFIILFSSLIITVIYEFTNLLQVIYFPTTPSYLLLLTFFACIAVANHTGIKSIIKTNSIIIVFILLSLFIIFAGTYTNLNINRIYPIFGKNLETTFLQGTENIFAFGGLIYLLFLSPYIKKQNQFTKIAVISITISGIFLAFSVATLLMIFPFITHSDEILSMYLLTRSIEFSEFIQRTDAVFILLWIISAFSYLSISFNFIIQIFGKLTNCKTNNKYLYSFIGIFFGLIILFQNQSTFKFLETTFYKYYMLGILIISLLILIIGNLKRKDSSI